MLLISVKCCDALLSLDESDVSYVLSIDETIIASKFCISAGDTVCMPVITIHVSSFLLLVE